MSDGHEIRCENSIMFGVLKDGVLEVKCRSERCGSRRGVVIIHRFDIANNGTLLGTARFKDPAYQEGGGGHAARR